ncbi:MAG: transglycosylase SLT domain-containing protein [Prochlorotrichaceae cyanobacterium]
MRSLSFQQRILIASGIVALGLGGTFALFSEAPLPWFTTQNVGNQIRGNGETLSPESLQRLSDPDLENLAQQHRPSLDRARARFLLAQRLANSNPAGAQQWLEGLEAEYPVVAAEILSLRANLAAQQGQRETAQSLWQQILEKHSDTPVAAEALYALGQTDPSYHDRLLAEWPAHPLSVEVALKRLEDNPDDLPRLLQVAQYGHYTFKLGEVLDRLVNEHKAKLTPEDWESIAFAEWEVVNFRGAAPAYAQAPATALNLYRAGRSYHLTENYDRARRFYRQLIQTFPNAPETALGLKHLASLQAETNPQEALQLWQQLYERFPEQQALALVEKASILAKVGSEKSAQQARQSVLTQHSQTEAAATLRWEAIQTAMKGGNSAVVTATIATLQQDNEAYPLSAQASFTVGRWLQDQGQQAQATKHFRWVLSHHPQSYFAWRSATHLGLPVGNFTTLWQAQPAVQMLPSEEPLTPLAGSPAFQELYRLGQTQAAWRLWQVEFTNRVQPTLEEQLTDGLVRLSVGQYLDGIFMLNSLAWRETAEDRTAYETLRQNPAYWQALYPFAFGDLVQTWSRDRSLNPLLVISLMRQESRFMPGIVSVAGAVGLMQVMPDTASWIAGQTEIGDYTLTDPNDSIKLGSWYLNYTHQEWQGNSLLAVASYNAGPGNVQDWIQRFGFADPDRFVEQIPFPETQGYVESVFENYWNYLRLYNPEVAELVNGFLLAKADI